MSSQAGGIGSSARPSWDDPAVADAEPSAAPAAAEAPPPPAPPVVRGPPPAAFSSFLPPGVREIAERVDPRDVRDVVARTLERMDPREVARDVARSLHDSLDIGSRAEAELNSDGDSVFIDVGAHVQFEGRGELRGRVEISQEGNPDDPPQYHVTVSAEVAAGMIAELGATAGGAKASVDAKIMLTAGGGVRFTFDSKEDAVAGANALAREAASRLPGPLPAQIREALRPPREEWAKVEESWSGVELEVGIEASAGAGIGIGGGIKLAGIGAEMGVEAKVGVSFEPGPPPKASIRGRGTIEGSAGASIGLRTEDMGVETGIGAGASASLEAEFEQSFELPEGTTIEDVLRSLAGGKPNAFEGAKSETSLTIRHSRGAQATGAGGTGEGFEIELSGDTGKIAEAVATIVSEGNLQAGLWRLDEAVRARATVYTESEGPSFPLEIGVSVMGVGAGMKIAAGGRDRTAESWPPPDTEAGTGDVVEWLFERI